MLGREAVLEAVTGYLRNHPEEIGRALRNAVGLRFGVPISGLCWLARGGAVSDPRELEIQSVPPGIRLGATLELMGTMVRASSVIYVERVLVGEDEAKLELRLEETTMTVLDEGDTPVAALIRSGALDLTKTGSLAAHMPRVQSLLSESKGNRLVIDLMKLPALAGNGIARRALALVTSFVTVRGVESDDGHVDVALRAFPRGFGGAARALREHVIMPARPWIRGMLGNGR